MTLIGTATLAMTRIAETAFGGCRRKRFNVGGYGSSAQVGPINIGPKLFTFDRTVCHFFNRRTVVSRHIAPHYPVVNNLRLNPNSIG